MIPDSFGQFLVCIVGRHNPPPFPTTLPAPTFELAGLGKGGLVIMSAALGLDLWDKDAALAPKAASFSTRAHLPF
jgi:hypothetical protein